ncbi:MAG TPA: hypothetical protein VF541_00100 [Longimicrobium sp.]
MRYLLYGLSAEADRPLPGLRAEPGAGDADLRLWIGSHPVAPSSISTPWYVADRMAADGQPTVAAFRGGGWLRLRYADATEFTLDAAGTRVGCTWQAPLTLEDACTYLLGAVCGLVLRLRGAACVHASVVAIDGGALLVCGPAGAGKSTTAAAFAARGRKVLADDVAALDAGAGGVTVRAAYPHLRLWPDAVETLYGPGADLPPLTPNWNKRYLDLAEGDPVFHGQALPVAGVAVLGGRESRDAPRMEPMRPADAVIAFVANTYMGWLPDLAAQARDLAVYARLAREVPFLRATAHADPARLGELCELLERAAGPGRSGGDG